MDLYQNLALSLSLSLSLSRYKVRHFCNLCLLSDISLRNAENVATKAWMGVSMFCSCYVKISKELTHFTVFYSLFKREM